MTGCSIIIVNYKSANLVVDCLRTIKTIGEVIVVDNFSQDDGKRIITSEFPNVKWIQLDYNAGFARANNAGIKATNSDAVLLLNPDTLVEANAIEECYKRLAASGYVAAGVQLLNADRSPQITGNYFMTGGLNHLMSLPYLGRLIRWLGYSLKVKKTNIAKAEGAVEVDWINGAFLMVKRSAIEKAG
ncbi:MAG TPA: glycosyltransferase family 2 protein, partial [Chitinophagaceae bacterium]